MTTENLSKLLPIRVVQEHRGCSRSFVYKLMDTGVLESVKIGSARRVLEQSLIKLMEEGYDNDTETE